MKKSEVRVGGVYVAKVSDRLVPVRIDSAHSRQGWNATNTKTGKRIHIKSAQRLHRPAKADRQKPAAVAKADQENARLRDERANAPDGMTTSERAMAKSADKKPRKEAKPKRVSALDAAAAVLKQAATAMNCKALVAAMAEQGLWQSPAGKTPHATLYAAILREISAKGDAARFKKTDRGQFAFNAAGA
jgi:flagellar biosynthesis GTPase FlhF